MLLAFDTATQAVTVALLRADGEPVCHDEVGHNSQGERLAPAVADVLRRAGATVRDLDAVAVGVGPGPFTGLRVGVATAAALAHALDVPAYGVCSLDAVGAGARAVLTDARRREVYWAVYDAAGARIAGPGVGRPQDLAATLRGHGVERLVGAGAALYREHFEGFAIEGPAHPSAVLVARLAAAGVRLPLLPLYLRRPDAATPGPRKPALR